MGQGPSKKISAEDMKFLKSRTNFTEKQIREWYKGFLTDCPSGELTKEKFVEVYSGFFPDGDAEAFCLNVFRTFDKNNSGKIDFKEFLLAISITSSGKPEEKLDWAFQMYDIDGNGTIEKSEMTQIIKAIYAMLGTEGAGMDPNARTDEIFERMDHNKDNKLTKEEFMQGCMADKQLYGMLLADDPRMK
jgi:Ca2+-binding EF-hand superfamily protein